MPHSILDNDLYKFTMQQAILELFPKAWAKYSFINRGEERFNQKFLEILATKISILEEEARLLPKERKELPIKCPYLKPSYLEYLSNYRFDPNEI
ncbi:MAG: nicotinate phosphoribosyltransferase, partial [Gammaproteobacteria bacterium]|nr:nicotinate phosphoribosyltransferase [Gammaproteobacteria bacterium]